MRRLTQQQKDDIRFGFHWISDKLRGVKHVKGDTWTEKRDRTKVFHVDNKQDIGAIIKRELKADRASQLMAFADHVYTASERVEDTMAADDRKEQFGEECVYCGKDSWTCEHAQGRDNGTGTLGEYETDAERNT